MLEPISYVRFAVTLFSILDPFAAIPLFLLLTRGQSRTERSRIARVAALGVFTILVVAGFSGDLILRFLGASLPAFQVGGGIVLFLMALSMINAQMSPQRQAPEEKKEATEKYGEEYSAIGVVPIAMPLLVGPGSISATIIYMERGAGWEHKSLSVAVIALICVGVWVVLQLARPIGDRLGQTGINILNRIFGLLLAAVAVQIFANGLRGLFPALG